MSCPHSILRLIADDTGLEAQFDGTLKGDQLDMLAGHVLSRQPSWVNLDFSQVSDTDEQAVNHVSTLTDAAHGVGSSLRVVAVAAAAAAVVARINLLR